MKCHWFETLHCTSCDFLDKPYLVGLKEKENQLLNFFPDDPLYLKPTIGLNDESSPSRNKMKLAVKENNGDIEFGFYTSEMIFKNLERCPLHLSGLNDLLIPLKKLLNEFKIIPYSLEQKKGELKYVIVTKCDVRNEFMMRFVLRSKESLDRLKKLSLKWQESFSGLVVVTANIQPEHKAIFEGEEEITLTPDSYLVYEYADVKLSLGARSFFQVTPEIAQKLYKIVGDEIINYKIESLLDLYCGVGAFAFYAARSCPDVVGVEISQEAIQSAKKMIPLNKSCGKIDFIAMDASLYVEKNHKNYHSVLVNPPRRGLTIEVIRNILKMNPEFLIYSSCNVQTLRRDFLELKGQYQIMSTQIFDMFPQTSHYETLMIMKKRTIS
jgi:23S rRNA (uracil747-C5)-methyltransferase